ncbi:MAG: hypothetical protein Q9175_004022 [Cornicularia normoerica]
MEVFGRPAAGSKDRGILIYGMWTASLTDQMYLTCGTGPILDQWHAYRYLLLLAAVLLGLVVSVYYAWRLRMERLTSSPAASTPEFSTADKAGWLDEKTKSTSLADGGDKRVEKVEPYENVAMQFPIVSVRPRLGPKRVTGSKVERKPMSESSESSANRRIQPLVFFSSLTGTTESCARSFLSELQTSLKDRSTTVLEPQIHDLSYIDYDDFYVTPPKSHNIDQHVQYFYLLILPSYNIDTALDNFLAHLQETHHDFRIDTAPLSSLAGYSVFGFGDKEGWSTEEEGFCSQAVEVDKWMAKLTGGKRAYPLGLGDVKSDSLRRLGEWRNGVIKALLDVAAHGALGEGVAGSGDAVESEEEGVDEAAKPEPALKIEARRPAKRKRLQNPGVDDLEDLGGKAGLRSADSSSKSRSSLPIDFTTSSTSPQVPKAMVPVSSPTHAALTKQGYTIIGTHSGVKICRWTKSALRGRGSCYKFSFYGIKSHLCMETTPSLSCSNKCVFCWRHGTNPVGTTWRWQVDPPEMIFEGAKEGHYKKIRMMRGVPGVRAERFQEAMQIRHCALSLVGEPIFYPHINEFVGMLHKEHISSFLVCNAQHPDQLDALKPVTQLYVSIDASNAESLRKIDRPLHQDYWQRFLRCLDILRVKRFRMRTVFRLTLVKGFNIDEEVEGYADLVALGLPSFIEIKGVTYCGTSSAGAGLTMQNVPFYAEITTFVEALNAALECRGLEYGIAAEHAHSCCVLIASKRFYVEEKWHTLIDYEKFFECLESGKDFGPEDYMGPPTPEWATWGRGGFDPADERVDRKGKPKIEKIR